jgi:insulysin
MRSQKPRPKKISPAASREFEGLVRTAQLEVDEAKWKEYLGDDGTPLLVDFLNYWKQILSSKEGGSQLLEALSELAEKYPVPGEGEEHPGSDVTYIQDLKAFKGDLRVSVDPGPMVQWGDLPVARF